MKMLPSVSDSFSLFKESLTSSSLVSYQRRVFVNPLKRLKNLNCSFKSLKKALFVACYSS